MKQMFLNLFAYLKRIHFFEFSFYLIIISIVGIYSKIGLVMMYAIEVTLAMAFMNVLYIESYYFRKLKDLGITEDGIKNDVNFPKNKKSEVVDNDKEKCNESN